MHTLGKRPSKRRWYSHQNLNNPTPHTASPESPLCTTNTQTRPGTPLLSATPKTSKSTLSLTTLESTQTEDNVPHDGSPAFTVPLLLAKHLGAETDSTTSINPSIEHISRPSSRATSSSAYPASSIQGSSPSRPHPVHTGTDSQPPWDRSVQIFWTRHVPPTSRLNLDNEKAFTESLVRLGGLTNPCPGFSGSDAPSAKHKGSTSLVNGELEVRVNRFERLGEKIQPQSPQNVDSFYFQLPDPIRFRIMKQLLASYNIHDKPVRMNSPVFLYEAWPVNRLREPKVWSTEYFDSLESVLSSLEPYMSVCSAMRADVLATLFLTRRFHVVYSPYVARELQPAATHYMDRYGPLMASITLEVDFTKLGGGWKPEAVNFSPELGMQRVQQLLENFVTNQLTRRGTTIRDLRVLVRRYHGHRPPPTARKPNKHRPGKQNRKPAATVQPNSPTPPARPYTPDALIASTLARLKSLGPVVETLTITGAPASFASELIASLHGSSSSSSSKAIQDSDTDTNQIAQQITHRYPAREYPLLPRQRAVVDYGPLDVPAEGRGENESGGGVQIVGCEDMEETSLGWEGAGYGCRLLVSRGAERRGGNEGGGDGDGKGKKGLLRRGREGKRRVVRRVSEGVKGVFALRGKVREGKGVAKKVGDEEYMIQGMEVENAVENMEVQKARSLGRIINTGRKGLFGHY